jgi:hypothetical protein
MKIHRKKYVLKAVLVKHVSYHFTPQYKIPVLQYSADKKDHLLQI